MATPDMEVIKDIPGYKVILKAILKSQIQQLVEQLASTTEEESVILTASVADGTLCHLGSDSGKVFLEDHEDIKSQFLGFCLKRHHKKKQEKEKQEAREREEALARSMQAVTPPRYDGMSNRMGFMPQHPPRYTSPRQQGPHPVAMSRVSPGGRNRSPGNRHQPYPMTRPPKTPLNFDQQTRPSGQGPSPASSKVPVGNKLDGQVIKIEPEDEEYKTNQNDSASVQNPANTKTNVSESSRPSSPSAKPSTPSQTPGPSASDNDDAKSESSTSTIPNEASDLKLSDTAPPGGLSLDSDLSNIISASSSVTDSNVQQPSTMQDSNEIQTSVGLDPNVSVKVEAAGDSEMDLEITGVELGQRPLQEPMSSQEWMANVQDVMQGASGSSADMSGQQGYNCIEDKKFGIKVEEREVHKVDQQSKDKGVKEIVSVDVSFDHKGDNNKGSLEENAAVEVLSTPEGSLQEVDVGNEKECGICGKTYRSKASLKRHVRVVHYENTIKCCYCNKLFATDNAKQAHIAEKHDKKYICSNCGKTFRQKSHLNEHMKYKHSSQSEELLNCPFENCGRKFVRRQVYQDHLNTHTKTKPYSCDKCKMSFSCRYAKRKHERLCIEGKKYKCKECDKEFTEGRSLIYHVQGAHGHERFFCVCGARYRYKPNLLRHKKKHKH